VAEFDHQFNNYQKLFDHMNGREDMFVEVGRLRDLFGGDKDRSVKNRL